MHHRYIVAAEGSRPTLDLKELALVSDKTLYYAVEWCSMLKASDVDPLYMANADAPHAVGIACDDLADPRSIDTWGGGGVLALLPSYCGSGHYSPGAASYLQSTALARETQVNLFASRGRLQFHLVKFGATAPEEWDPAHIEPYAFSFVVWSLEVPRPFRSYHAWVSSTSRYSGSPASYRVPFNFAAWDMGGDGEWRMAVSHACPVRSGSGATALLLSIDNLTSSLEGNTSIVACLQGGVRPGEEAWYGLGRGVQPGAHTDSLGTLVETPLYRRGDIQVRVMDERMQEVGDVGEHVFCLSFFRV